MSSAKHAERVGQAIGILEKLADNSSETEAGTFNAAADVLRDYGRDLDQEIDVDRPSGLGVSQYRAAILFLTGRVMEWASPEQTSVLANAVDQLEERVQS